MKRKLTLAGLAAATLLLPAAHAQMTGTSHPEQLNDQITTAPDPMTEPHYVKPSPAVPVTATPSGNTAAPAAIPATPITSTQTQANPGETSADATYVGSGAQIAPPATEGRRLLTSSSDPDANIVSSVPEVPGQLNAGTVVSARLQNPLSTETNHVGDTFLATVVAPVKQNGMILIPVGSQIRGRISSVHGGRRFTGSAFIRLQPDFIILPDGVAHRLYANLIDLDNFSDARVDSEGTVVGASHPKAALASVGLTTASAAVAGALIGGGVGAGVGAAVGVGAGAIWWLKRDVQQQLPVGTGLVFSLDAPLALTSGLQSAALTR